jgi:hypothetical protein
MESSLGGFPLFYRLQLSSLGLSFLELAITIAASFTPFFRTHSLSDDRLAV